MPYDELTLDHIAERAGTTRQTVLRHFGSKERLALAAAEWYSPRIEAATEVMVWKLLRRDLGRSVAATEAVLDTLVRGVLAIVADPDPSSGEPS